MSEPQSYNDSSGTVVSTGIRQSGVPGADKGIAWHSRSYSVWDVCLSNSVVHTGVNSAVTPLFDFVCHCMHIA